MKNLSTLFLWRFTSLLGILACTLHGLDGKEPSLHLSQQPLPAHQAAASMSLPDGFRSTLFAGEPEVKQPISFCIDDRNRLWVAEAYNYPNHGETPGDRIIILEDHDGDGRHDQRKVFFDGLNYVSGIEVGFGGVWVMSPPAMYFIPDRNQDDEPDAEPQILLDGFGNHANAHNMANGFAWGPDGWLYATHGRTNWSMIGRPGDSEQQRRRFDGGVWRYHPLEHRWESYADGTTNPWGIDWNDFGDAFVTNCVNPHLFQVIQGAHYEPWRGRSSSQYAYQRIGTIADHLHFVGLSNVRQGLGSSQEDQAGGGHAHCGTMIYLGNHLPMEFRGRLFTNNIHGRRINQDHLSRKGSGYTASHKTDLMRSADPWFMGVTLAYGANGEIYVSDWSDTGECHSVRDTKRDTGRLYRISYLQTQFQQPNLRACDELELAEHQLNDNEWYVRHSRRLLQEKAANGDDLTMVKARLHQQLESTLPIPKRLRALWTLHVIDGLTEDNLHHLLTDSNESIRSWAVTLVSENKKINPDTSASLRQLASTGDSPKVRLAIASAAQRLPNKTRWNLVTALAARTEDHGDQNLPLMTWYAIEPLIQDDPDRYVQLSLETTSPFLRKNMARRIAEHEDNRILIDQLFHGFLTRDNRLGVKQLLEGLIEGLTTQMSYSNLTHWTEFYSTIRESTTEDTVQLIHRLAFQLGDRNAARVLAGLATDNSRTLQERRSALKALGDRQIEGFDLSLIQLLQQPDLRDLAISGLSKYNTRKVQRAILDGFHSFRPIEKSLALKTLCTHESGAMEVIQDIKSGKMAVDDLDASSIRLMRQYSNPIISKELEARWGTVTQSDSSQSKQIELFKKVLTPATIRDANLVNGQRIYSKRCSNCHTFFGQGGNLGPDLTGAQRTNTAYLLENIIAPHSTVPNAFLLQIIQTVDGRLLSGIVESQTPDSLTLVNENQRSVIPVNQIEQRKTTRESIMPTGLINGLSEKEVRDLIAYLQR